MWICVHVCVWRISYYRLVIHSAHPLPSKISDVVRYETRIQCMGLSPWHPINNLSFEKDPSMEEAGRYRLLWGLSMAKSHVNYKTVSAWTKYLLNWRYLVQNNQFVVQMQPNAAIIADTTVRRCCPLSLSSMSYFKDSLNFKWGFQTFTTCGMWGSTSNQPFNHRALGPSVATWSLFWCWI